MGRPDSTRSSTAAATASASRSRRPVASVRVWRASTIPRGMPRMSTAATAMSPVETMSRRRISGLEAEADATDGDDALRVARVVADLAAQPRDVHVERLRRAEPVLVPDLGHDVLAPDGMSGAAHQQGEEVELLRAELERLVAAPRQAGREVHPQVGDAQLLRGDAAQLRAHAGEQLGQAEGL